jgi:hypothetical protein
MAYKRDQELPDKERTQGLQRDARVYLGRHFCRGRNDDDDAGARVDVVVGVGLRVKTWPPKIVRAEPTG